MFKVELTANIKSLEDIFKLKDEFRKEIIENGLDPILDQAVQELRTLVYNLVSKEVRFKTTIESYTEAAADHDINIPKTHKDIIKELFDIDLEKVNPNLDYTKYGASNAVLLNDKRAILKIDESLFSDVNQSYEKAVKFFQEAVFIDLSGPEPSYFYPDPNFDIRKWVKAFCSRDTGVTKKTDKRFEKFKAKQESEWRLKQAGVQELARHSVNITNVINSILDGQYDDALQQLRSKPYSRLNHYIEQKIEQIKKDQPITADLKVYTNILTLIKNVRFEKTIRKSGSRYELVSTYDNADEESYESFFAELESLLSVWFITNEQEWFFKLVDAADKIVEKYRTGMKVI